jgi:hypothetical protein
MSKNIIWDLLVSKKRDDFISKNPLISTKALETAEEYLRIAHENGEKFGYFRNTLMFDQVLRDFKCTCSVTYIYIYNSINIKIINFIWRVRPWKL